MSRRAVNPNRRLVDSGSNPLVGSLHQKSRSSPLLSVGLVLLVGFTFEVCCFSGASSIDLGLYLVIFALKISGCVSSDWLLLSWLR